MPERKKMSRKKSVIISSLTIGLYITYVILLFRYHPFVVSAEETVKDEKYHYYLFSTDIIQGLSLANDPHLIFPYRQSCLHSNNNKSYFHNHISSYIHIRRNFTSYLSIPYIYTLPSSFPQSHYPTAYSDKISFQIIYH